ncbi:hypothetical protein HWD35_20740 [Tsukamurella tyrosinosolvens]|uniref:hypothetical protein n=1 Tax=Tsukamurella tyrosinosolvens TaxID=57704 RepID=UPI001CE0CA41|nr:hypothetical protein [Tsukamurella tyrosinosolvens]MCA4997153.1 hypothetical protein [Tsukamurella tyrosinosolvens]
MNAPYVSPMQTGQLERRLSKAFQRAPYLSTKTWRPKYAGSRQRATCDECFAAQHESGGAYGPRLHVRMVRTMPDGTQLRLCTAHAELWKSFDEATKPEKPPKKKARR